MTYVNGALAFENLRPLTVHWYLRICRRPVVNGALVFENLRPLTGAIYRHFVTIK